MAGAARIDEVFPLGLAWMSDVAESARPGDEPLRILVQRAKAGDLAAFEQLVILHEQRVFRTALRLLRNVADAQDAAQEVLLRLHKHLRSFNEDQSFPSWLYRIVVNVCHDANQRRGRHLGAPLEEAIAAEAAAESGSAPDPFELASQQQQRQWIADSLATLPEKERAALVLRDLEGLSTAEVATILGSSESTVRSQISAARLKIRKLRDRRLRRPR